MTPTLPSSPSHLEATGGSASYSLQVSTKLEVKSIVERLEHLTFPSLRQRTQTQHLREPIYGAAVSWKGEPVALILAHGAESKTTAEIVSLYVRRDHRGRGLSRALMGGMERLLSRQGYQRVQLAYRSDWPARPIVERRLMQFQWNPPVTNLSLGKFDVGSSAEAWLAAPMNKVKLHPDFEILPWSELADSDLQSLQIDQPGDYPEELAPLEEPECIEPLNSLALRHRGRIIGWIITHRLDAQTIQYTRLHVDPPYQRLGRGLPLLAAAIRKQIEWGIPFGVFQVRSDNPRMQRLIQRRLRPFLFTWTESRRSEKSLRLI